MINKIAVKYGQYASLVRILNLQRNIHYADEERNPKQTCLNIVILPYKLQGKILK